MKTQTSKPSNTQTFEKVGRTHIMLMNMETLEIAELKYVLEYYINEKGLKYFTAFDKVYKEWFEVQVKEHQEI